mmetsp:Transcript_70514/g.198905  ORF Transcript_70514/g.198905 Transcript_70514/m.198905 type:complete len:280 (+) Transcript_70514:54-893(+)
MHVVRSHSQARGHFSISFGQLSHNRRPLPHKVLCVDIHQSPVAAPGHPVRETQVVWLAHRPEAKLLVVPHQSFMLLVLILDRQQLGPAAVEGRALSVPAADRHREQHPEPPRDLGDIGRLLLLGVRVRRVFRGLAAPDPLLAPITCEAPHLDRLQMQHAPGLGPAAGFAHLPILAVQRHLIPRTGDLLAQLHTEALCCPLHLFEGHEVLVALDAASTAAAVAGAAAFAAAVAAAGHTCGAHAAALHMLREQHPAQTSAVKPGRRAKAHQRKQHKPAEHE